MFTLDLVTISKTDDDKFIVAVNQEHKADKKIDTPMDRSEIKTFIADTEEDVSVLLKKYLPMIKKGGTDAEAYNKGFEKANKTK